MAAVTELHMISRTLRRACLSRWTKDSIVDHVTVKLPAPIFDTMAREARRELQVPQGTLEIGATGAVDWFKFEGIKYERLDGVYWSVKADGETAK